MDEILENADEILSNVMSLKTLSINNWAEIMHIRNIEQAAERIKKMVMERENHAID
jgi:ERCC4-type nuclease